MRRWRDLGIAVVVAVLAWAAIVRLFDIPRYVLPGPRAVLDAVIEQRSELIGHTAVTGGEALLGITAGIAFGVISAIVITSSRRFGAVVHSLLVWSQVVPKIALVPIFVIWFGFGLWPKVLIAFLIAYFPIVVDTAAGLTSVERDFGKLTRSLGAGRIQVFTKIRLPGALPHFFSGLKVAITLAVVGAVLGEFIGGERGLGFLLLSASARLDTPLTFACVLLMSVLGFVMFEAVELLERVIVRWQPAGPVRATPVDAG